LLSLALLLFAAAGAQSTESAKTTFYLVESAMRSPEGRPLGSSVALVKRVVDRENARIEESVISLRGKEAAKEIITIIRPGAAKASLSSEDGEISGEAELIGDAWQWRQMRFTSKLRTSGMMVEGEDQFNPDGLTAVKKVLGADGKVRITIEEKGVVIGRSAYEILRARLLPAP